MQCTWPKLARLALCGLARPSPVHSTIIHNRLGTTSAPWLASFKPLFSSNTLFLQLQRRPYATVKTLPNIRLPSTPPPPLGSNEVGQAVLDSTEISPAPAKSSEPIITSAEVGRAAAQAVRISVQQGNKDDAYLIVRSLYHARLPDSPLYPPDLSFLGEPNHALIPFNKTVSPRLPAHALLHTLIRRGETEQASKFVQGMISMGTRVRCQSLEAALKGFEQGSFNSPPTHFSPSHPLKSIDVTLLKPHMVANAQITGGALRILQATRQSGGRSTGRMYRYLIAMCIINGEIILASLLFGVLLRDWQAREKAKAAAAAAAANILQPLSSSDVSALPELIGQAPMPRHQELKNMCSFITWNLSKPHINDESSKSAFTASLQALTNLANDMDERRLAANLEPLIVAIYKCPRTSQMVWVSQDGKKPKRIEAYTYLHNVLDRLISSLPEREREQAHRRVIVGPPKYNIPPALEPLNPFTYNALLHYALRHQRSIDRARFVLTNLLEHIEGALNVRRIQAKRGLISIFDRAKKDFPVGEVQALMDEFGFVSPTLADLIAVPDDYPLNTYALSTRIALLVSKGEIQAVVDALPEILPGLFPPTPSPGTPWVVAAKAANKWREDGLEKAVQLGPVVFTALLNALRKDGRTGLAESVFVYGLEAEKKSFDINVSRQQEPRPGGKRKVLIRPWCLPVHAYTTMIQAYNNERVRLHPKKPYAKGWGLTPEGTPLPYHTSKHGYSPDPVKREALARQMILQTYRLMMSAPEALMSRLETLEELAEAGMQASRDRSAKPELEIKIAMGRGKNEFILPEPDVWFFHSLLDMFMQTPDDPLLPGVVSEMRKRGFAVNQRVVEAVVERWGEEALEAVHSGWENVSERNRKPFMQADDLWAVYKDNVASRVGWKRWAPKDRVAWNPSKLKERAAKRAGKPGGPVNHDDIQDALAGDSAWTALSNSDVLNAFSDHDFAQSLS